ncbi:MAG: C1 family peptidase [Myxococcota bacterium]|nr:C1 family peptidase [Myxococcota bacterium]
MSQDISSKQIEYYRTAFADDPRARVAQNAVCGRDVKSLSLSRAHVQQMDDTFSTRLDQWSATHQKRSGRCWLFAALNLFRVGAMQKLNVKNFEFSQAHIHFWDKLERSNHFLEVMIERAELSSDDRTTHFMLGDPIGDGGQWNMAMNLIRKHGLVPKSAYPESHSSSETRFMNATLKEILRTAAYELRTKAASGASESDIRAHKEARMADIWRVLCIHLGTPPEQFDWQWRDKDKEFHRAGTMTPQEFLAEYVTEDWENYVCLVDDPRNDYYRTYTVDCLQNVAGGPPVVYLNIPVGEMKDITRRLLEDGIPVWMGCDVGQQMDRKLGLWDAKLFETQELYGVRYGMDKAARLHHRQTMMTHAMLFTGVDVVDGTTRRWRVENSWGEDNGVKGYYTMNDSWFDEYMFEIAAPRTYLTGRMLEALATEPVVLPAWDPMGSLARSEAL